MAERETDALGERDDGGLAERAPATVEKLETEVARLKAEAEQNRRRGRGKTPSSGPAALS